MRIVKVSQKSKSFFQLLKFVKVQTHLQLVKVVVRFKYFSNLKNVSKVKMLLKICEFCKVKMF